MFDDYSIYEFNEAKSKILKDFGDDFKPIIITAIKKKILPRYLRQNFLESYPKKK